MLATGSIKVTGALAVLIPVTGCAPAPDLASRVDEMVAAHNAHDVERQLALFADDARILLPDRSVIEGTADIRQLLEWDSALRHRYELSDLELRGDTVFAGTAHEESDWFRSAGIGRVAHEPGTRIVFRQDRIAELRIAPLAASDRTLTQQAVGDFVQWAAEARTDLLESLMPGNRFVYSRDAALTWIDALREWHESRPPAY